MLSCCSCLASDMLDQPALMDTAGGLPLDSRFVQFLRAFPLHHPAEFTGGQIADWLDQILAGADPTQVGYEAAHV